MPETDEDLVAVYLARGNEDVFAELVKRHLSGVYSFALGLVGQEFAAERGFHDLAVLQDVAAATQVDTHVPCPLDNVAVRIHGATVAALVADDCE